MRSANYQIVALADQRNKIQSEDAGRGARGDAAIGCPGSDLGGGR